MATKSGSETIGAAGDKSRMTLFKDDRAEDMGAIVVSVLVIAAVMVLSTKKAEPVPVAAPAAITAPAPATATPTEPAKK